MSYFTTTQNKLHQSNNAFQHTHNPVDEEGTQKLNKSYKSTQCTQVPLNTILIVIPKTADSYLFTVETERKVM